MQMYNLLTNIDKHKSFYAKELKTILKYQSQITRINFTSYKEFETKYNLKQKQ